MQRGRGRRARTADGFSRSVTSAHDREPLSAGQELAVVGLGSHALLQGCATRSTPIRSSLGVSRAEEAPLNAACVDQLRPRSRVAPRSSSRPMPPAFGTTATPTTPSPSATRPSACGRSCRPPRETSTTSPTSGSRSPRSPGSPAAVDASRRPPVPGKRSTAARTSLSPSSRTTCGSAPPSRRTTPASAAPYQPLCRRRRHFELAIGPHVPTWGHPDHDGDVMSAALGAYLAWSTARHGWVKSQGLDRRQARRLLPRGCTPYWTQPRAPRGSRP
jgi:hypothetical protein